VREGDENINSLRMAYGENDRAVLVGKINSLRMACG